MKHTRVLAATCVAFLGATGPYAASAELVAAVANPTVMGPIPATATPGAPSHEYPFFSTTVDLESRGYIEEEYFFEGTASRFDIPVNLTYANTPTATANVIGTGLPYRTRLIVRRPASPMIFNGTVFMEWQNVTFGYDIDAGWLQSSEHIIRRGYAWIAVSAQRVAVHGANGLRAWSPARYGSLDLTAGGTVTDDSLAYDIFSQAAQAIRNPTGADPMGGLTVKNLIAVGISQAAIRLVAYHNAVHPLAGVFDAFMPALHGGLVRTDMGTKVFKVLTETDVARDQTTVRQPNSDRFRRWEIAGAAHLDFRVAQALAPLQMRDLGVSLPTNCTLPPFSRIPAAFVYNASLDALVDWVNQGVEPPIAPDIETVSIGAPAEIARDSVGNALGGIRLSEHAVPTAVNTGVNGPATSACRTFGTYEPFDQSTLDALYPQHGAYVSQVVHVVEQNVEDRFIVREDAMVSIRAAAQSGIGKPQ
jgi:hypothetical protein